MRFLRHSEPQIACPEPVERTNLNLTYAGDSSRPNKFDRATQNLPFGHRNYYELTPSCDFYSEAGLSSWRARRGERAAKWQFQARAGRFSVFLTRILYFATLVGDYTYG